MSLNSATLERDLLETAAGQAVYDSLVQANVNPRTVPLEMVNRLLAAECRFRLFIGSSDRDPLVAACS